MTTYTAYFRTDAELRRRAVRCRHPRAGACPRTRALRRYPSALTFEPYDGGMPVNEIAIHTADHDELAVWRDEDMHLRLAARDLLDALTDLVERDRAEAASCGFTDDEMSWLDDARRAIAKAKGGAP